jgi:lyso-ornithine lipid O-acyltransferase
VSYVITTYVLRAIARDNKRKVSWSTRAMSFHAILMNKALDIKVSLTNGGNAARGDKKYLILSNHLSYLDVFVIASIFPASFIASIDEVKDAFLLGKMTELSGGFFVERRSRAGLRAEIESITEIAKMGINIALFPEGTTSDGTQVFPFKTPLLSIAEKAGVEILPICVKYRRINGQKITERNKDTVYYYGDMKFFDHLFKLLPVKSVEVELTVLDKIDPRFATSRKELANLVYDMISSAFLDEDIREITSVHKQINIQESN